MKFYLYLLSACTLAFSSLTATNEPTQEITDFFSSITTQSDTDKASIGNLEGDSYVFQNQGIEYRVFFPNTPKIEKTQLGELTSCFIRQKYYGFGVADLSNPEVHGRYEKILNVFNELKEKELSLFFQNEFCLVFIDTVSSKGLIHLRVIAPEKNQFWHFVLAESSCCFFIGAGQEMNLEYFNDFINGVIVTPLEND